MDLFFLAFLLIIKISLQAIAFDFIVLFNNENNNQNIQSLFHLEFLSTDRLCIGSPYQCLSFNFNPKSSLTYAIRIDKNETQTSASSFNTSLSSSFIEKKEILYMFRHEDILCGVQFIDKFKLSSIEMIEFKYILAIDVQPDQNASTIGLLPENSNNNYSPFIEQMYHNNIIDSPIFSIQFNNNNSTGKITIGKDYKLEGYRKALHTPITKYEYEDQHITHIDQIMFLDKRHILEENIGVYIDESFGFIQLPYYHLDIINKFLSNTNLNCMKLELVRDKKRSGSITYTSFLCTKRSNYNMKDTILFFKFNKDYVLEFNAADLFIDFNKYLVVCTLIIAKEERDQKWIIGYPLLKNYIIEHDYNKMVITLYSSTFQHAFLIKSIYIFNIVMNLLMSIIFYYVKKETISSKL